MIKIKINEEYFILPDNEKWDASKLRHICPDQKSRHKWIDEHMKGAIDLTEKNCIYCHKKVDKKVLFIFNLWQFHNE